MQLRAVNAKRKKAKYKAELWSRALSAPGSGARAKGRGDEAGAE